MHLVYPENFALPLASICITEENLKLSSCKICRGGAKQGALWSMWKWWICEGHSTLVFSLLLTSGRSFRQTSTRKRDLGYDIEDTRLWGLAQSPFLQLKACVKALGWETRKVISGYGAWGNRTKTMYYWALAAVVQTLDCAIHRIWIAQLVSLILIRWIVIYPVDSGIQPLNNRGLVCGTIGLCDESISWAR